MQLPRSSQKLTLIVIASALLICVLPYQATSAEIRQIAGGFNQITDLQAEPGKPNAIWVVQRGGLISLLENEVPFPLPILDLREEIDITRGESLLGLAFSPNFLEDGHFFVNSTRRSPENTLESQIVRFTVTARDPPSADPQSALVILAWDQPFNDHNGGSLAFGPDGFLYITSGDGGNDGDRFESQNPASLLGKIIRLDVSAASAGSPYAIPTSNPFVGNADVRDEIWAFGKRNPWRMSFDRLTGDLWIADVGEDDQEEINFEPAGFAGGANYGWPVFEGSMVFDDSRPLGPGELTFPLFEYSIRVTNDCSITGGYVYRGNLHPRFFGNYFFGDFCSGRVWMLTPAPADQPEAEPEVREVTRIPGLLTTFGKSADGNILAGTLNGSIYEIYDPATLPWAAAADVGPFLRHLDGVGVFDLTEYPWVHHETLGFVYTESTDLNDLWIFLPGLGWLWTNPETFPYLYSANNAAYFYFLNEGQPERFFYSFGSSEWISLPGV